MKQKWKECEKNQITEKTIDPVNGVEFKGCRHAESQTLRVKVCLCLGWQVVEIWFNGKSLGENLRLTEPANDCRSFFNQI